MIVELPPNGLTLTCRHQNNKAGDASHVNQIPTSVSFRRNSVAGAEEG